MKVCVLYYDDFGEFEVVYTFSQFRDKIEAVALENRTYMSEEKLKFKPDKTLAQLDPAEIDLFIIPGGDPSYLFDNQKLKDFLIKLENNNKYIAAICGGTELLAYHGILNNKRCTGDSSGLNKNADYIDLFKKAKIINEDVVVDGKIITSIGQAYGEFVIELGKIMDIYNNEEEIEADYKWLKNIK